MTEHKVALRYASSFLESSLDKNSLLTVSEDMEMIVSTLEANRNLMGVLQSPVIKADTKRAILEEIFVSRISVESMNFLKFIIEKNREFLLHDIIKRFLELRDQHLGIVNVEVKTAFEFTEDQKLELQKKFESTLNKKVRFQFSIDKELIGGFVAKAGDTVYDASLKHQLEVLKKQFTQGGASLN